MSIVKCIKQGVFKGLILTLFVILLNCAQQSATLMDEEYADENEEFQSELLGMLELSEEDLSQDSDFLDKLEVDNSAESQNVSAFSDASEEEDSLDDMSSHNPM